MPERDPGQRRHDSPGGERDRAALEGITAAWEETNAALNDTERRYRELVEYSLGLICTHDLAGTILSVNPAAASSLGYRPEDGIGRNLREFLAPEIRHLFDAYLARIKERGQDAGLMRMASRSGAIRIWMYRNVLTQARAGGPYVLGHAIDVTERIATERTLRERERALRAARSELEARVNERTSELQKANERLRIEIAEREEAERSRERALIEQRDTLAFLSNLSDRLAPIVTIEGLIETVARLSVPFLADWTLAHIISEDGTVRCVPGVHVDPSRTAALGTLATTLASGEVSTDSYLARIISTSRLAFLTPADGDLEVLLAGGGEAAATVRVLGARMTALLPLVTDGGVRAVLWLVSGDESRLTPSRALVFEDVARRLRLAIDRIQLYREAQDANRLKDEFLGTLSHELRTPLNAIFGWARILGTRNLDESTAHAVAVIERNARAQIRLIEEVLDVSRIITGKMSLAAETVDVRPILRSAIDAVRPAMQAKRIRCEERIDPDLPMVLADPHRLQQVFWNLLSNALKFTGTDGTISLTLRPAQESVEFEITDTGVGIRRTVLPFVFDRFRQADSSMTRGHGGLGLGLAIVRHIVELHGGTVRAESPGEGRGATFTIALPVAGHPRGVAPSSAEVSGSATPRAALQGLMVLVVEDHEDARELISGVLEAAGARVVSASTAGEAVAHARTLKPDVLVADLGLPGEDGFALLNDLRDMYPQLPAIALTAYARATDRERALAAGFQQYAIKPIDPEQLVQIVASAL
jgi:PAS domain S-box-containing protein